MLKGWESALVEDLILCDYTLLDQGMIVLSEFLYLIFPSSLNSPHIEGDIDLVEETFVRRSTKRSKVPPKLRCTQENALIPSLCLAYIPKF
ncbi:MAG: hypothetical protein QXL67_02625 [Candidatus Bathyarchaeia archaeon]